MLDALYHSTDILAGKNVLIVDDDMRNIFALSSVLEEQGMNVVSADNGRDAIRLLSEQSAVDIVLMDIMMPEMDGIDTMLEIRKTPAVQGPADCRGDRQGDEGRSRKVHGSGSVGLSIETGGHGYPAGGAALVAASLSLMLADARGA